MREKDAEVSRGGTVRREESTARMSLTLAVTLDFGTEITQGMEGIQGTQVLVRETPIAELHELYYQR